jgi:hypothetical protein
MGSDNFFSKLASIDPIAQALHLPGSNKYAQSEAERANSAPDPGPYNGIAPTLAGANAGYAPGGPGANPNYVPFSVQRPGGIFGGLQRIASSAGATSPNLGEGQVLPNSPTAPITTLRTGQQPGQPNLYQSPPPIAPNPYVAAVANAGPKPVNTNTIFNRGGAQPGVWG